MSLTPEVIVQAYQSGYFPMSDSREDEEVYFVTPKQRCLLPIADFHIAKRLQRSLRLAQFSISFDRDFAGVIARCAESRKLESETWISLTIEKVFVELHQQGLAHSVEAYNRDGELVGGLYGLALGSAFFGESMFHHETNASKFALCHLAARLHYAGYTLWDAQFTNSHLLTFGAYEISNEDYMSQLHKAVNQLSKTKFMHEYNSHELINFIN